MSKFNYPSFMATALDSFYCFHCKLSNEIYITQALCVSLFAKINSYKDDLRNVITENSKLNCSIQLLWVYGD